MNKLFLSSLLLGLAITAIGCGGEDCQSLCEKGRDCPGAPAVDCAASCAQSEALVEASGCQAQSDAYFECGSEHELECSAESPCNEQASALATCTATFCFANPSAAACQVSEGDS